MTYKFTARCKSGKVKAFECEAENYKQARALLSEFIESN